MKNIDIYTDGACSGNPGPGGYATIFKNGNKILVHTDGANFTTNNCMELKAVVKAIEIAKMINRNDIYYTIYTDSAYVYNAINNSLFTHWKRNGFISIRGKIIANASLWSDFYRLEKYVNYKVVKVKGHSDNRMNNLADHVAVHTRNIFKEKIKKEVI